MSSKQEKRVRIWVTEDTKKRLEKMKVLIETDRGLRAESFETVLSRKLDGMDKTSNLLSDIYAITEDAEKILFLDDMAAEFKKIRGVINKFDKAFTKEVFKD